MKESKMKGLKKKLVGFACAAILIVMAIGGSTIAYFTDTDSKTNTFTYGDVDVTLQENGGTGPVNKTEFLPITNTSDPTADAHYVKKDVTVENVSTQDTDVYIRTFIAVPSMLYKSQALHLVFETSLASAWTLSGIYERYIGEPSVQNTYVVLAYTYTGTNTAAGYIATAGRLEKGNKTTSLLKGVYTDARADVRDNKVVMWNTAGDMSGGYTDTGYTLNGERKFEIYVNTQAVQADGFSTASDAFTAAYGNKDPWGTVIITQADIPVYTA